MQFAWYDAELQGDGDYGRLSTGEEMQALIEHEGLTAPPEGTVAIFEISPTEDFQGEVTAVWVPPGPACNLILALLGGLGLKRDLEPLSDDPAKAMTCLRAELGL